MLLAVDYAVEAADDGDAAPRTRFTRQRDGRFEDLLRRHHPQLRRLATGILSGPGTVDDVLQNAYLKAYRRLPRAFANVEHERAWLYQVVYRCCLDELRRRRRTSVEQPLVDAEAQSDGLLRLAIGQALRGVRPEGRAALVLVDVLGFDYDSAARILHLSRATLAARLAAARATFRSHFPEGGSDD